MVRPRTSFFRYNCAPPGARPRPNLEMPLNKKLLDSLRAAVDNYVDPVLGCTLATAGVVEDVGLDQGTASLAIKLPIPADRYAKQFASSLGKAVVAVPGIENAEIEIDWKVAAAPVPEGTEPLPGVRNIIAVASGKGGVGKSTTAVNLALALAAEGARVGILDADIYGPSQPAMMGLTGQRPVSEDGRILQPLVAYGLQCMSIGFLVDDDQPMVWRGPMATSALTQLLTGTAWQDLDYMIVDMPPGTGDIQLTLSQQVPVSGSVIVTTPQDIALHDAMKGLKMFEKVGIPVLGIVENMSIHICSDCGHREPIFGEGGGQKMSTRYGVPLLGELPLDTQIRQEADAGCPSVVANPDSAVAEIYIDVARKMAAGIASRTAGAAEEFPSIVIEDD
jgi:ATP-binding protein involved in chromosome partitioning